ncbi:MAG: ubiquinol-cytochrome c reductase iron-sulfur subunit [Acidimicrobiales bacterium]
MDTIAIIAIVAVVLLGAVLLFAVSRKRDADSAINAVSAETRRRDAERVKATVGADAAQSGRDVEKAAVLARREGELVPIDDSAIEPWVAPDPETIGVARRQFLNRAIVAIFGLNLTAFGLAIIAQLWPGASEGFGSKIKVGPLADVRAQIVAGNGYLYRPEGRMWVTEYPAGALEKGQAIYGSTAAWPGIQAGFKALYQKCPHLGCRVPDCQSSQYFECPCHGSFYNQVGEKRGGPAPRGMDYFAMSIESDNLVVDTGNIIGGPPIGTNTTGQEREGPSCLGASSHA